MAQWDPDRDPEPSGWNRHPRSNRYRAGCDPKKEFNPSDGPPPGHRHPWDIETGWTPL